MCADSFVTRAATGVLFAIAAFYVATGTDQTARTRRGRYSRRPDAVRCE